MIISRTILNVWSVLWSHGPQDLNQSESNKSKKDCIEKSHFLKPSAYSMILCSLVSPSSEVSLQLQQKHPLVQAKDNQELLYYQRQL